MSFYKVRTKEQLQKLSTKQKALKDQIRAENEAELLSTEERLYNVGKIIKPLAEQTITAPLKQIVSEKQDQQHALPSIPSRPALPSSSVTPPQGRAFPGQRICFN